MPLSLSIALSFARSLMSFFSAFILLSSFAALVCVVFLVILVMLSLNCFHSDCGLLVIVCWCSICIILFSNLIPMELIVSSSFSLCTRYKGYVHLPLPMCGASLDAKQMATIL